METMSEYEALQRYDDMLDEVYGPYEVAGIEIMPSDALKNCDEIAYQMGFQDWCDSEGIEVE